MTFFLTEETPFIQYFYALVMSVVKTLMYSVEGRFHTTTTYSQSRTWILLYMIIGCYMFSSNEYPLEFKVLISNGMMHFVLNAFYAAVADLFK